MLGCRYFIFLRQNSTSNYKVTARPLQPSAMHHLQLASACSLMRLRLQIHFLKCVKEMLNSCEYGANSNWSIGPIQTWSGILQAASCTYYTMLCLSAFSCSHVPLTIPTALAITTTATSCHNRLCARTVAQQRGATRDWQGVALYERSCLKPALTQTRSCEAMWPCPKAARGKHLLGLETITHRMATKNNFHIQTR